MVNLNNYLLQEGAALLEGEKLGDTRQETKKAAKPAGPKRNATIQKTLEEGMLYLAWITSKA